MNSLVVFFAVIGAAVAAPQFLVQPPNTPAVVLDPFGRPLDTAEVAAARAQHYQAKVFEGHILKKRSVGHAVAYSFPTAVSHQSRVDVRTSPAVVAEHVVAAPVFAEPVVEARAVVAAPAAVSHQSRVDVRTSPAVVAASPVVAAAPTYYAEPVVAARAFHTVPSAAVYAAPSATVYAGGSAVSHQSRVDVETSPAVVSQHIVAPAVVEARSAWAPSVYASTW